MYSRAIILHGVCFSQFDKTANFFSHKMCLIFASHLQWQMVRPSRHGANESTCWFVCWSMSGRTVISDWRDRFGWLDSCHYCFGMGCRIAGIHPWRPSIHTFYGFQIVDLRCRGICCHFDRCSQSFFCGWKIQTTHIYHKFLTKSWIKLTLSNRSSKNDLQLLLNRMDTLCLWQLFAATVWRFQCIRFSEYQHRRNTIHRCEVRLLESLAN